MEILKEMINIITKNKIKNIEIIGDNPTNSSKINKLYNGIQSGQFLDEEAAINYFYGLDSKGKSNFKKLKKRLRGRLINTVFFVDIHKPSFSEIQKAYYTCYKNLAAIKILIGRAARRSAISLAEQTIKKAIQFEFSDIVLDIARILRIHYSAIESNSAKYDLYNRYVKSYTKILNAELIAEEYYQTIVHYENNYKSDKQEIEKTAIAYSQELKRYAKTMQSYRLNLYSFRVFVLRYQIVNDYNNMLLECEKAVTYFESKKYQPSKGALIVFLYTILVCCIQLKKFGKGETTANHCLNLLNDGVPNWFHTLEQYLLLSFHTNNLLQAYQIFLKASNNKNFNNLYENASENWKAHKAYIHYFISIGAIKLPKNEKTRLKPFRLSQFLNDMPVHSKDKRRRNIPILIIHVLFLLQKREYEKVIDRVESLNLYCYRYLRKDDTFRSNCFIKMLLLLPKANFHREAVIRKAEKFYTKLLEHPSNISMQASEIEIMPYEMLWEYVLDSLDNKIYSKR